jgi:dTDP-4-amino-4,6-dideoxygalactose transaminase
VSNRDIPFYKPAFSAAQRAGIAAGIDQALQSGQLMMGPWKDRFESLFRDLTGCEHAVSVNSATTALQIALQHYDVKGRDVLVPAGAFLTDVSSVLFAGGTPVLVDLDPETLSFDLKDLERRITPRARGIVWVHLTGIIAANWQDLLELARKHGLFVIEDAAHAHGAEIDGRPAGSLGHAGVFSFYPTKVVTSGTGGMLTTNDAELARYATEMRVFGKNAAGDIVHLGNDWFLDEIRACVGYHHAAQLTEQLAARRRLAARYRERLANQPGMRLLDVGPSHLPSWYHFSVVLADPIDRPRLMAALKADGIATKVIYKPLHHERVFAHLDDGMLGRTEHILDRHLCLPIFPDLAEDDVDYVAERLISHVRSHV